MVGVEWSNWRPDSQDLVFIRFWYVFNYPITEPTTTTISTNHLQNKHLHSPHLNWEGRKEGERKGGREEGKKRGKRKERKEGGRDTHASYTWLLYKPAQLYRTLPPGKPCIA